jgi:hypothetical protein
VCFAGPGAGANLVAVDLAVETLNQGQVPSMPFYAHWNGQQWIVHSKWGMRQLPFNAMLPFRGLPDEYGLRHPSDELVVGGLGRVMLTVWMPPLLKPSGAPFAGLNNYGNTCFINASLQMLRDSGLASWLAMHNAALAQMPLSRSLWRVLCGDSTDAAMLAFKGATNQLFGGFFADNQQHDADEFVARLVGALEDEANRGRRSLLGEGAGTVLPFGFQLLRHQLCSSCTLHTTKPVHFHTISLPVQPSLTDMLAAFQQPEPMVDFRCERCSCLNTTNAWYGQAGVPPPEILITQKRFDFDHASQTSHKISESCRLADVIPSPFEQTSDGLPTAEYMVDAGMVHIGNTASSGHYLAFQSPIQSNSLHVFDDETVKCYDRNALSSEAYTRNSYMVRLKLCPTSQTAQRNAERRQAAEAERLRLEREQKQQREAEEVARRQAAEAERLRLEREQKQQREAEEVARRQAAEAERLRLERQQRFMASQQTEADERAGDVYQAVSSTDEALLAADIDAIAEQHRESQTRQQKPQAEAAHIRPNADLQCQLAVVKGELLVQARCRVAQQEQTRQQRTAAVEKRRQQQEAEKRATEEAAARRQQAEKERNASLKRQRAEQRRQQEKEAHQRESVATSSASTSTVASASTGLAEINGSSLRGSSSGAEEPELLGLDPGSAVARDDEGCKTPTANAPHRRALSSPEPKSSQESLSSDDDFEKPKGAPASALALCTHTSHLHAAPAGCTNMPPSQAALACYTRRLHSHASLAGCTRTLHAQATLACFTRRLHLQAALACCTLRHLCSAHAKVDMIQCSSPSGAKAK